MVAASDYAFRCLCRNHGVDLAYTQMLHAKNLVRDRSFGRSHLDVYECCDPRSEARPWLDAQRNMFVDATSADDRDRNTIPAEWEPATRGPVIVQLAGHNVNLVAEAAQLVLDHTGGKVDGIDLNLGKFCNCALASRMLATAVLSHHDRIFVPRVSTGDRSERKLRGVPNGARH
jgi:tRNA-dihydrouridine synthase